MIARFSQSVLFGALLGFSLSAGAVPATRCGGGQGPKPLTDISGTVGKSFRVLPTYGGLAEFSLWENSASVIYRAEDGRVFRHGLSDGRTINFARSTIPLSRMSDPGERYVVTEPDSWLFDTRQGGNWTHFLTGSSNIQHLFWARAPLTLSPDLYSFAITKSAKDEQQFNVFRYRAGKKTAVRNCPLIIPVSPVPLQMGEGHFFPNVFMYHVKPMAGGNELSLYYLNVETCALNGLGTYNHLIQGDVESVQWIGAINSIAVKVDHPTKNLLWDNGPGGCRYYDIDNRKPFLLNPRVPVIATWDKNSKGVNLVFLNAQKKASVLVNSAPFHDLRPRDLAISSDGRRLYAAPRLQAGEARTLIELAVPQ